MLGSVVQILASSLLLNTGGGHVPLLKGWVTFRRSLPPLLTHKTERRFSACPKKLALALVLRLCCLCCGPVEEAPPQKGLFRKGQVAVAGAAPRNLAESSSFFAVGESRVVAVAVPVPFALNVVGVETAVALGSAAVTPPATAPAQSGVEKEQPAFA